MSLERSGSPEQQHPKRYEFSKSVVQGVLPKVFDLSRREHNQYTAGSEVFRSEYGDCAMVTSVFEDKKVRISAAVRNCNGTMNFLHHTISWVERGQGQHVCGGNCYCTFFDANGTDFFVTYDAHDKRRQLSDIELAEIPTTLLRLVNGDKSHDPFGDDSIVARSHIALLRRTVPTHNIPQVFHPAFTTAMENVKRPR